MLGSRRDASDAIFRQNAIIDSLYNKWPNSELQTDGIAGLPEGQMGNSEVGHLNIGAGRVVYQDLAKINKACDENSLESMPNLQAISIRYRTYQALHLMA